MTRKSCDREARAETQIAAAKTPLRPCPICGKPAVYATRPFCSARCADVDLHRWLTGSYAIPALPDEETGTEEPGQDHE